ncbi:hypothetical protein ACLB2K_025550 [Fragaria x ananassa]
MATTCLMLFALTLSASLISGAHPQSETQALIALKKSLSDPLNVTGTWDASHPKPCSWKHVTCNGDKKVIGLSLIKSRLSGHLVPKLGSLSYLQKIIMDHNELSGPIPYSLGDLLSAKVLKNAAQGRLGVGRQETVPILPKSSKLGTGAKNGRLGGIMNKKRREKEKNVDVLLVSETTMAQGWIIDGGDEDVESDLTNEMVGDDLGVGSGLEPRRSSRLQAIRELHEDDFVSDEEEEDEIDFEFETDTEEVQEEYGEE